MASRRSGADHFTQGITGSPPPAPELELQEAEVWYGRRSESPEQRTQAESTTRRRGGVPVRAAEKAAASSLPVRIPEWSKILKQEYRERRRSGCEEDEEEEEEEEEEEDEMAGRRLPPHEYLARTRMASLSVHEGMGRTLKGRDLWRVRDAVWEKTGFLN